MNKSKKIYHGTNAKFKEFDLCKSSDATVWFSDNKDMVKKGYDGACGNKYVMERTIDEKALKLADWDMADKYLINFLRPRNLAGFFLSTGFTQNVEMQ